MSERVPTDREARLAAREAEVEALFRELSERAEDAERASEHKTAYIGHVAHEFRTPLNSILGFTALLAEEDERLSPETRREYLDIVLRNARHLLHVVMDILNLSKVEAGTLEVTLGPLDATAAAKAAIETMRPQARDRDITLRMVASAPRTIAADGGRLRQVLFNLLENATKYSPRGSEVVVDVVDRGEYVRIEVRDRGPGITEENQARLFKEFSRINPVGKKVAGAGLGLALSKRLVELMHGHIGVESRIGEGSTFWVELPRTQLGPPERAAGSKTTETDRGGTVAVVDDEPDIRTFARVVLERVGYRVVVDDGSPGVADRLVASVPSVILLDLNLAERTGADVLRELRAVPRLSAARVIAFTASSTAQERANAEEAGFDSFLTKPVEPQALVHAIDAARRSFAQPPADPDDYLAPLRARFLQRLPGRVSAMEHALEQKDREALRREVHKLRGAAGGYGFTDLSNAAAALEEWLRDAPAEEWEARVRPVLLEMEAASAAPAPS